MTAPDGQTLQREYLRHPGAVGIIALDGAGRVALVRQYRHAVRHRLIEPPAGLLDVDGEAYVLAAQRELAEEVGLAADTWHVLVDLFTTPGIIAESLRVYLARDLRPVAAPDGFVKEGEEAEMELSWAPLADLVDAVLAGDLHNPTLVSGVLAARVAPAGRLRLAATRRRPLAGPRRVPRPVSAEPPSDRGGPMAQTPLPVIDAHLHLWDPTTGWYDWLEREPDILQRRFVFDDARAEMAALAVVRRRAGAGRRPRR